MNDGGLVADASAILAALKNEPFGEFDPEHLLRTSISTVNLCEVLTKLHSDGLSEEQAAAAVAKLDLRVIAFDQRLATVAAELWFRTLRMGLSLGDRACLALGRGLGCPVVTADRAWANLDVGVEVILIR
ncbi:MAG TPA: type II toxin-antitoxin system VapC family toxin [Stellaceae bacterium]|nr:type II toxin-antitoxin system VapC family toxin [Stellaceae bacterium]